MLRQVSYEKTLYFNVGTKMYFDNKPIKLLHVQQELNFLKRFCSNKSF